MTAAITAAFILTAVLLVAALVVVWARRKTILRPMAIPLALAAAVAGTVTVGSTLGFAVPLIGGITAPIGETVVLAVKLLMDDGIYLTLDLPNGPRLYWLPWDKETAEAVQEMLSDPNNAGVTTLVPPFEFSWDQHKPSFQPLPQPKWLPDKPPEPPQAPRFAA